MRDKLTPEERQSLSATAIAWREARDVSKPGSPQFEEYDRLYKEAQAELYRRL